MTDELTNDTQGQNPTADSAQTDGPDTPVSESDTPVSGTGAVESDGAAGPGTSQDSKAGIPVAAPAGGRSGGRGQRGAGGPQGRQGGRGSRQRGRGGQAAPREASEFEETVVKVYRCATVVKGGRRFSFAAMAVVGDRKGRVGIGYGKANEVPSAVEKATKIARRSVIRVKLQGTTLPHRVMSKFGASKVLLLPAGEGTGVIAGAVVRAVLELAGVKDVLTKSYGSNSPKNLTKATFEGLRNLRTKEDVEKLRQVAIAG